MRVDSAHIASVAPTLPEGTAGPGGPQVPKDPAAAARQFEEVLVREFVRNMTKDLFTGGLGGKDSPGWVKAQGSAQSDALTDAVTKHLVDSGTLGIKDMLMRKWGEASDGGAAEMDRVFELKQKQAIPVDQFMQFPLQTSGHKTGIDL
ncbi:MAG: hypothetical protein ACI9W4_001462 [Rhodothermales bacterium]|jgi:hypothetical protein